MSPHYRSGWKSTRKSLEAFAGIRAMVGAVAFAVMAVVAPQNAAADTDEVYCLALNIYFEARGEPEAGKRAVGHVVMNRTKNPRFPHSICEVVQQGGEDRRHRCQFSWYCDGKSDTPRDLVAWIESVQIAHEIFLGVSKDPTKGALWYHAEYVSPGWGRALKVGPKIGQHIFYLTGMGKKLGTQTASAEKSEDPSL